MWAVVLPVFLSGAGWWLALVMFDSLELGRIVFAIMLALLGALAGAFGAFAVLRHQGMLRRRARIIASVGGILGLAIAPLVGDAWRS